MKALAAAAERRQRQGRARLRAWRRSMMDCGEDGCGECRVCRYYEFKEYVSMVAPRDVPCSMTYDPAVLDHLKHSN